MSEKESGGYAFPLADSCAEYARTNRSDANGMSLRDYFAAKAMQGYLASIPETVEPVEFSVQIARDAYLIADAMIEARK